MKQLDGFDYRLGKPVTLTTREWRELARDALAHGGWITRAQGETWIYQRRKLLGPTIVAEVYAYLHP